PAAPVDPSSLRASCRAVNGERRTFADNQRDNTIAAAILGFAEYNGHRWPISIASGYFDLGGFAVIAAALEAAPSVRILLGVEPHPPRATTSHEDVRATREDVVHAVEDLRQALV